MSNSKPNSLIHYVDFNSSKMKRSKRSLREEENATTPTSELEKGLNGTKFGKIYYTRATLHNETNKKTTSTHGTLLYTSTRLLLDLKTNLMVIFDEPSNIHSFRSFQRTTSPKWPNSRIPRNLINLPYFYLQFTFLRNNTWAGYNSQRVDKSMELLL